MSIAKSERMRAGIRAEHDDAVGQQNRFFNVVGHDEDGAGRHLLAEPQFQQFAAQVFGGQHVERGKRLVHEQHFRLDHQRAGKTDALLHAAGKFLGISGFETVETDRIDHPQRAFVALDGGNAARFQRRLDISMTVSHGKQRETLEDDGDVRNLRPIGWPCHSTSPEEGLLRPVSMRSRVDLPEPEGPSRAMILPAHFEVGGRDDLNTVAVGLEIILFDGPSANDRIVQGLVTPEVISRRARIPELVFGGHEGGRASPRSLRKKSDVADSAAAKSA